MVIVVALLLTTGLGLAESEEGGKSNPVVLMETTLGRFIIELWQDKAPVTVKNFLRYMDEGFYDGTIFHRVIKGFVIQGGGFTAQMKRKRTHKPIRNEAVAELKNDRWTIAMARTGEIHSATSQFYINLANNTFLDHRDDTPKGYGYAVFGRVIGGTDVVWKISMVKTTKLGPYRDVPEVPVAIKSMKRQ
ncbi:MAG: peptidyl-prolyl cis-trans isomerase [Proteobacteria bacterium]|nr:peptidyl-prolyl cis-trans isomerase [Pseudomonadota bacterium]